MNDNTDIIKWIDLRHKLPDLDGEYVVSITRGNYTFSAIAFYEAESKSWYLSMEGEKGNQIKEQINGWVENLGVYVR